MELIDLRTGDDLEPIAKAVCSEHGIPNAVKP